MSVRTSGRAATADPTAVRTSGRPRLPTRAGPIVPLIAVVLFPIRIFSGLGWLRAAVEKLIDPTWWSGDALRQFLAEQRDAALSFMIPISDAVFAPASVPISLAVVFGQGAIAVGLVTTRLLRPALWAGITLNVVFVAMGAVNPSVFYLVIELTLLAAVNAGLVGGDPRRPRPVVVGVAAGVGLALLPYVETVHPAHVIDDPAIVLATVALLAAATNALGMHGPDRTPASDVT